MMETVEQEQKLQVPEKRRPAQPCAAVCEPFLRLTAV